MNNEELQSRREFFKKAAKGALPILGAIALAATPAIMKAAETPMGCSYSDCSMSCSGGCMGCSGGCQGSCSQACSSNCFTYCRGIAGAGY